MANPEPNYKLTADDRKLIEKYREQFVNTGGNDIAELIERPGVNFFNNYVAAALQSGLWSQLLMLRKLREAGLLNDAPGVTSKGNDRA